ncbi:MAG: glycoside hydrolase, partial [Lentisphaerae bacterium]|nr:glycoside hydrolase [Lentisphaerota bacterium]
MPDQHQATPPGGVVNKSPDFARVYVGSPSIAVLPDGSYVASHDFFGPGTNKDTTLVFRSTDRGLHWEKLCSLRGQWWSGLFVHDGVLYTMGTNGPGGGVAIRRSDDGGRTWTTPRDEHTGLLRTGGHHHCAPVPVVEWQGRLWRAYEWKNEGGKLADNEVFVMSAPLVADLLHADNWRASEHVRWPGEPPYLGWREGNVVVAPDDNLVVIIRVDEVLRGGMAAMVRLTPDGRTLAFDPARDFIRFPGGCKKFTVRHDPVSGRYWALANWAQEQDMPPKALNVERMRNTLALTSSADLRNWTIEAVALYHPDVRNVGFQYADWQFESDDIIAVVRTAFAGATNCHNATYLTFHRILNFRRMGGACRDRKHAIPAEGRAQAHYTINGASPADVVPQAPVTWNTPDAFDPKTDLCAAYYQKFYGPAANEMKALVEHYARHAPDMRGIHSAPIIK